MITCLTQVRAGGADPAAWLHKAAAAVDGLHYLTPQASAQTVATLCDTLLEAPVLCSPLSGSFDKSASFLHSLLTSHLAHVRVTAYKALAGAACIGPPALRGRTHGLLCHSTVVKCLVTQGLAMADSKAFATQLLQAVAVEGTSSEGKAGLAGWMVWLACYERDPVAGGTIAGVINHLQDWR